VPFVSTAETSDRFYAVAWMYFALVTFVFHFINLKNKAAEAKKSLYFLILFSGLMIYGLTMKSDIDSLGIYILLAYGITSGFQYKTESVFQSRFLKWYLTIIWLSFLFFIVLSIINLADMGFSHINTYSAIVYFPHRNILMEYFAVFTFFYISFFKFKKWKSFIIQAVALSSAIFFQSKAALLSNLIGFAVLDRRIMYFYLLLIIGLLIYNIGHFRTYYNDKWDYFRKQKTFGFFEKNLDLIYLTCYSGSSFDRRNTWVWTASNINFLGHGIGSWKYDFMGKVQLREVGADVLHRRPHNDVLLILYELGFFGLVFLIFLFNAIIKSRFYVFIPLLLLAFPLERAEFVMLLSVAASNLFYHERNEH
jgi:hypothetical protein